MAVRFSADGQDYSSSSSPPAGPCTITCWLMLSADRNNYSCIWAADQAGGATYFDLTTDVDGTTLRVFNHADGTLVGPSLTLGTWYRTGVSLAADGTCILYWATSGGALTAVPRALPVTAVTSPVLTIGDDGTGVDWLNGRVANFKHYSAVLSQDEIETELSRYVPTRTADLVRWHPFLSADTTDRSGNGRTLTPTGAGATTEDGPPIVWSPQSLSRPFACPRSANF